MQPASSPNESTAAMAGLSQVFSLVLWPISHEHISVWDSLIIHGMIGFNSVYWRVDSLCYPMVWNREPLVHKKCHGPTKLWKTVGPYNIMYMSLFRRPLPEIFATYTGVRQLIAPLYCMIACCGSLPIMYTLAAARYWLWLCVMHKLGVKGCSGT